MKQFYLTMALLCLSLSGTAATAQDSQPVRSARDEARLRFQLAQQDKTRLTNGDALAARLELEKDHYEVQRGTEATLIHGDCGIAGCDESYFVATQYDTKRANTQSAVVAGIVLVRKVGSDFTPKIIKVFTRKELDAIVR